MNPTDQDGEELQKTTPKWSCDARPTQRALGRFPDVADRHGTTQPALTHNRGVYRAQQERMETRRCYPIGRRATSPEVRAFFHAGRRRSRGEHEVRRLGAWDLVHTLVMSRQVMFSSARGLAAGLVVEILSLLEPSVVSAFWRISHPNPHGIPAGSRPTLRTTSQTSKFRRLLPVSIRS